MVVAIGNLLPAPLRLTEQHNCESPVSFSLQWFFSTLAVFPLALDLSSRQCRSILILLSEIKLAVKGE